MIFFKKTKIVIDAFTDNASVFNYHPIEKATKFIPSWWKSLPTSVERPYRDMMMDEPTIKKCAGFTSLFKEGFILPSWTDIQIKTTDNSYTFKVALSFIEPALQHHETWQYGETFNDYIHLKIISPWFLKCKESVEFACVQPSWNLVNHWSDIQILPGVIDFKYQTSVNVNMFLAKNREKIFINAGTPLYHILPLTDKEVIIKNHLVDTTEMNKIFVETRYGSFNDSWRKIKNTCPHKLLWKK